VNDRYSDPHVLSNPLLYFPDVSSDRTPFFSRN